MADPVDLVIEYSIDGGTTWHHGKTVPAWVGEDTLAMKLQRAAVRDNARDWHGDVGAVATRVLPEDDPRGALNQPPAREMPLPVGAEWVLAGPDGQPVTLGDLMGEPAIEVTMRASADTLMALFMSMELDLAEDLAGQGVVPVSVVHGDPGDASDAEALLQLTRLAEACGSRSMRGGNDYMTFLFRGDDAPVAALRFTSQVDAIARPWWRVTPTFAPERPR